MKSLRSLVVVIFVAVCSCKKEDPTVTGGGPGGNAIVYVTPEHHQDLVTDCTIYIKYGTTSPPADSVYDDPIAVSTALSPDHTTPVAIFRNLKAGAYYLYGKGYHPQYNPPYVHGGLPYIISREIVEPTVYLPVYSYQP